jgi:hypothetical protein
MLLATTWKARPLSDQQNNRMMAIWGKIEADEASNPAMERLCWYLNADGSGGVTVSRVSDPDAAMAWALEVSLALGEFIEIDTRPVLDLDQAMPVIGRALERTS